MPMLATASARILVALFAFALIWNIALYTLPARDTDWNYAYNIVYSTLFLFGGAVAVWYVRRAGGGTTIGKALAFSGIGIIAWGLGLLVWAYYNLILKVEIPYPSLADILFVLIYPFLGLGIWYFLKIFQPLLTTRLIAESILIVLIAAFLTFPVYADNLRDPELSGWQLFFTFLYPLGDVILLSAALIALRVGGGRIRRGLLFLILGMIAQTIADYLFTYRTIQETYWNGDIADTGYTIAAFLFSMGIIGVIRDLAAPSSSSPAPSVPTAA